MVYYEKEYYIEAKKQLKEEYKVGYQKAENYIRGSVYGLEHEENCLMQILDDFLSAQNEAKPLNKITGPNLRIYSDSVIKAEADRLVNRKLFRIECISIIPLTLMLLVFFRSFLFNEAAFTVHNMNHLQIKGFDLVYVSMFVFAYGIRNITSKLFFDNNKLAKICNATFVILMIVIAYVAMKVLKLDTPNAIPISFPVFITIFLLSAIICITCIVIGNRNRVRNSASNILDEGFEEDNEEELQLEQVVCPACGKEHDFDYPRCPYCRHKYLM